MQALNDAWQSGELDRLGDFYHAEAVLLPPDAGDPIVGRDAIVASYRDFDEAAVLLHFAVTELLTYGFDRTHLVHMRFDVRYELEGSRYEESGLEIYSLIEQEDGRFVIVWRGQSVLDSRTL